MLTENYFVVWRLFDHAVIRVVFLYYELSYSEFESVLVLNNEGNLRGFLGVI